MEKILMIGCSNMLGKHLAFHQVFQNQNKISINKHNYMMDSNTKWFNLSCPGAGNSYIRWRLFDFLENQTPDYVYLQFSGLVRRDWYFDISNEDKLYVKDDHAFTKSKNHIYLAGGNRIVDDDYFPNVLRKLSYSFMDDNSNNHHSLQEIYCAISILDKLKIKYNWSVYYDPLNPPTESTKLEGKIKKWPDFINLQNKLPSPLNYIIDAGYKVNDGVHFEYDQYVNFIENHKNLIHIN